jgi:hypothetical protein
MNAKKFPTAALAGLGLAALTLLAGCANGPSWGAWSKRPTDAQVAAVMARAADQPAIAQNANAPTQTMRYAATSR